LSVVGLLERGTGKEVVPSKVLELSQEEQTFEFTGLEAEPVPSMLRNFSAPVKLEHAQRDEDLAFLAAYDTDSFNRWEAAQTLGEKAVKDFYANMGDSSASCELSTGFVDALRRILTDKETTDLTLLAYALILPAESTLMEAMAPPIDPMRLHNARGAVKKAIASALHDDLEKRYAELSPNPGEELIIDGPNAAKRSLRNICLGYLSMAKDDASTERCMAQFTEARSRGCMTDKLAALEQLVEVPDCPEAKKAVKQFYEDAKGDALVINKWFSMQAGADLEDALQRVQLLMQHPDFTLKNPNRLRSVISVFSGNVAGFHKADGSGYAFLADKILEVDKLNPQMASRLAKAFATWAKLDAERQGLVQARLKALNQQKDSLSKDTFEVVSTVLGAKA